MSHHDHTTAHFTPAHEEHADEWHHHSTEEGEPQEEHGGYAQPALLAKSLGLIVVGTLALMAVTALYFNSTFNQLHRERTDVDLGKAARDYRDTTSKALKDGYTWADPIEGHLRVPIEAARQKVIAQYAGQASGKDASPK